MRQMFAPPLEGRVAEQERKLAARRAAEERERLFAQLKAGRQASGSGSQAR